MVILSLSIEPGKSREERTIQEDSLYIEVKSECIRCLPVYLDVRNSYHMVCRAYRVY